jgi:hypothetical protein
MSTAAAVSARALGEGKARVVTLSATGDGCDAGAAVQPTTTIAEDIQ